MQQQVWHFDVPPNGWYCTRLLRNMSPHNSRQRFSWSWSGEYHIREAENRKHRSKRIYPSVTTYLDAIYHLVTTGCGTVQTAKHWPQLTRHSNPYALVIHIKTATTGWSFTSDSSTNIFNSNFIVFWVIRPSIQ